MDIVLVKEDKSKLKIMACVKVISLVFKWLIQRVDYFLLSKSATPDLLSEIAGILPPQSPQVLLDLAQELLD